MTIALFSSGGKDSTLALDRARRDGLDVRYFVNIYDGVSERVAFHGVRRTLIEAQAGALGLEPILAATGPDDPYEGVFGRVLDDLGRRGVTGVVFGNIHLADVRAWYEDRTRAAGLAHIEPLWDDPPASLVAEVVARGFAGVVVSVDLAQDARDLLGHALDDAFVRTVTARSTMDPCGERGEYHSFVFDGPGFRHPVLIERGETREDRNHHLLDLTLASATAAKESP